MLGIGFDSRFVLSIVKLRVSSPQTSRTAADRVNNTRTNKIQESKRQYQGTPALLLSLIFPKKTQGLKKELQVDPCKENTSAKLMTIFVSWEDASIDNRLYVHYLIIYMKKKFITSFRSANKLTLVIYLVWHSLFRTMINANSGPRYESLQLSAFVLDRMTVRTFSQKVFQLVLYIFNIIKLKKREEEES